MRFHATLRDDERDLFERELDSFVPPRVFDAHAHLSAKAHYQAGQYGQTQSESLPEVVGLDLYRDAVGGMLPGRQLDGLFIPGALAADPEMINGFIAEQIRDEPRCRGVMVVRPDMDADYVREQAQRLGMSGLKCYHLLTNRGAGQSAETTPTWDAEIPDYLPDHLVAVADELGLTITLHMVKARALAEPTNQVAIRDYCERYPNMRMILAHAARGFNPHHTLEGIGSLAGLDNVWFDCSAVTDCGAIEAILQAFGPERLLYGTDFTVSHFRGRCVAIGDSFLWLYEDSVDWSQASHTELRPIFVGLESLRCLKLAARHARLTDTQVEAVFHDNAAALLGVG